MAISRKDFDQLTIGDIIIDACGKKWKVVGVTEKANKEVLLYHQNDNYRFTYVNGCFLDENKTIFQSLSDPKATIVPFV